MVFSPSCGLGFVVAGSRWRAEDQLGAIVQAAVDYAATMPADANKRSFLSTYFEVRNLDAVSITPLSLLPWSTVFAASSQ